MITRPILTPRPGKPNQPAPPTGRPTHGQIVRIHAGQSHGFILDAESREVFFHRTDTTWGTFNTLLVGDTVAFELIEDRVSGPRATRVRKGSTARAPRTQKLAAPLTSASSRAPARG